MSNDNAEIPLAGGAPIPRSIDREWRQRVFGASRAVSKRARILKLLAERDSDGKPLQREVIAQRVGCCASTVANVAKSVGLPMRAYTKRDGGK